jgi:hypothetical protein
MTNENAEICNDGTKYLKMGFPNLAQVDKPVFYRLLAL